MLSSKKSFKIWYLQMLSGVSAMPVTLKCFNERALFDNSEKRAGVQTPRTHPYPSSSDPGMARFIKKVYQGGPLHAGRVICTKAPQDLQNGAWCLDPPTRTQASNQRHQLHASDVQHCSYHSNMITRYEYFIFNIDSDSKSNCKFYQDKCVCLINLSQSMCLVPSAGMRLVAVSWWNSGARNYGTLSL